MKRKDKPPVGPYEVIGPFGGVVLHKTEEELRHFLRCWKQEPEGPLPDTGEFMTTAGPVPWRKVTP